MRDASTYRGAKRTRVKAWAKAQASKFIELWQAEEVPLQLQPIRTPRTGKYMPHQGKQECARRIRQMAKAA